MLWFPNVQQPIHKNGNYGDEKSSLYKLCQKIFRTISRDSVSCAEGENEVIDRHCHHHYGDGDGDGGAYI